MTLLSFFHLILAILGLGFLVFIHELGHYFVARRAGMRVEVFSIGFGKAWKEWERKGVKWRVCILPFGGYVKIAGMEKKDGVEPHQIPDGFYSKKPWARIKVALAGPLANIGFAFVAFALIWMGGGQEKPFQELTHLVGYVDAESVLRSVDLQPGDQLLTFNHAPFDGYSDLLMKVALTGDAAEIAGEHIDYWSGKKSPFSALLPAAATPNERAAQFGVMPAQYLIFDHYSSPASPLQNSGIEKGDRLIWADGEILFSQRQLSSVLNQSVAFLTVKRDGETVHTLVPRIKLSDLRVSAAFKDELDDWRHAAALKGGLTDLYFIPYQLDSSGVVEEIVPFVDADEHVEASLRAGDRIVALCGQPISTAYALLEKLQERSSLLIVQRGKEVATAWKTADSAFASSFDMADLERVVRSIGGQENEAGALKLLSPISLKPLSELDLDARTRAQISAQYEAQKKAIDALENPQEKELLLNALEQSQKRLMLGAVLKDSTLAYNPTPFKLFASVFDQTWKTLTHLFTGSLSPKSMSGPVGIVQALQQSWSTSAKDALFWLGFVSLNLAVLNLLPIPVLDGGHILFTGIEIVTGKPIRSKTMERWIIPFVVLLVLLFIYLTYQDISRLLHRLF